jgi:LAO/AO transport system kinase
MNELGKKVLAGDVRAASRLIRNLEDNIADTKTSLKHIFPHTGKAHVIGITGAPGAGKSTLTDELVYVLRKRDKTVGVLAVDPTSPFTGGAILGDRIRMIRHAEDPGVFVRSMATRGSMGGLSKAVGDGIHVLDVMGKDYIIVETVGVGQQEVEIINHAHTVMVVQVPGMGDEIQAIKAGLMEIADVFVVNKSDREGAPKLYKEILNMLNMSQFPDGWRPPVIKVGTSLEPHEFNRDVAKIVDEIENHREHLIEKNLLAGRMRRKTQAEINEALRAAILEPVLDRLVANGELNEMVDRLTKRETDPYTLADEVAKKYLVQPE